MSWRRVIYPVMAYFRRRRLAEMLKTYPNLENYSVLDVGGRPFIWDLLKGECHTVPRQLVLLNTSSETAITPSLDYSIKIADGCQLPYADKSFDLVFSNSVIEHVGDLAQMTQFAKECNRVGKNIYIQTPNRWFPLEAHFGAIFIHWLPDNWYKALSFLSLRYFFAFNSPSERADFKRELETTRLLSFRQLQRLFPQQKIVAEKVLGWPKSFVVLSLPHKDAAAVITLL